jgi:hypothetical protein
MTSAGIIKFNGSPAYCDIQANIALILAKYLAKTFCT